MFGGLIVINQGRMTPPAGGEREPGLRKISPEIYFIRR